MPFNSQEFVFSLEVKTPPKAALQLRDLQTQLYYEADFDCGRTNKPPARSDAYVTNIDALKAALREILEQLEKVT